MPVTWDNTDSPDAREQDRIKILQQEASQAQHPQDEPAAGRELADYSYADQIRAQGTPSAPVPKKSGSITWDEEKPSVTDSILKGAKGTGAAVADLAGGLFKFPAGIGMAAIGSAMGERPDIAREAAHAAVEEKFPSFGSQDPSLKDNLGYKGVMYPFDKLSEGIDWLGNLTNDKGLGGSIKQALDIGTFAIPGLAHRAGKFGGKFLGDETRAPEYARRGDEPPSPTNPADLNAPEVRVSPGARYMLNVDELPKGLDGRTEPTLGRGKITWDDGEPTMGELPDIRTPEEISLQEAANKLKGEEFQGAQQGEMFAPENPYIPNNTPMEVDPQSGMPFRQPESSDIAQQAYEQQPQGDLFKSREPTLESQLVPKDLQDTVRPPEQQVIPRTQFSLDQGPTIPLKGESTVDYQSTTIPSIPKELQGEPLPQTPEQTQYKKRGIGELKYSGPTAEKRAAQSERDKISEQDRLARGSNVTMQRELPLSQNPYAKKQGGNFDPSEIGKGLAKLFNRADKKEPIQPEPNKRDEPILPVGTRRYMASDTRTVEDFIKQEVTNPAMQKDMGKSIGNFIPGSSIAEITNPLVKWIDSRIKNHAREALINKENAKYGAKFEPSLGVGKARWDARKRSDEGALTVFERLPWEDAKDAMDLWINKYDKEGRPMDAKSLRADGMNPEQTKALLAAGKQMDVFQQKYNADAAKYGFAPIAPRTSFFPHIFQGDYRVFVRDKEGNAKWVEGANTEFQAKKIMEDMKSKFPGMDIQFKEAGSKYDINDTSSFREAMGLLSKDSPEYNALQKAYTEVLTKRGFKKSTLFRKGAGGFMGTKEGKAGMKDALDGIGLYLDRGYNFLSNQRQRADLGNVLKGLKDSGFDTKARIPNTYDFISRHVDNSTGALKDGLEMINTELEDIGRTLGLGKSFVSNVIGRLNGAASALWLSTPKFVVAQLLQPLYNLPAGLRLKNLTGSDRSVTMAFGKAYKSYVLPDAYDISAMNWAKEHGFVDSKILDLMGMKSESVTSKIGKAGSLYTRWGLGKVEQEVVRSPSFFFYDNILKDVIKNKEERWLQAGALSNHYMVDYSRQDAPHIYGSMGTAGSAVRPLKQFSHAYFGQMLEYISHTKNEKDIKPLAAFLAVQANMSGLKGMIGLAEATVVINAINQAFDWEIPTPNQLLATMGVPQWLRFGSVSATTGLDLSGTTGAPQMGQMSALPGVQFGVKAAKDIGTYGVRKIQGTDTEADKMKAIQSVAPTLLQGQVEDAFTAPGMGPPNPNNRMQPDTGPRDFGDRVARNIMGGRSVKETEEKDNIRELKQSDKLDKDHRNELLDLMVDRISEGKENDQKVIDKWLKLGGNPDNLTNEIVDQMKGRAKTYAERYVNNLSGLTGAQKAVKLKEFNLMLDTASADKLSEFMKEAK